MKGRIFVEDFTKII